MQRKRKLYAIKILNWVKRKLEFYAIIFKKARRAYSVGSRIVQLPTGDRAASCSGCSARLAGDTAANRKGFCLGWRKK